MNEGIKVILLSGSVTDRAESLVNRGPFDAIFAASRGPATVSESMKDAEKNLTTVAKNLARLL